MKRTRTSRALAFVLITGLCLAAGSGVASADPLTFVGFDINAGAGEARPNADSAAAHFDAAASLLGSLTLTTFESVMAGPFSSLAFDGMILTGTASDDEEQRIRNTAGGVASSRVLGYNTTTGGRHYVEIFGGTLTSTFATPVQVFGFYFAGSQLDSNTVTFNNGSPQSFTLPFQPFTLVTPTEFIAGGVGFFGFIDEDASISSITISTNVDIIGIDDVRHVVSQRPVPEPTSATLLTLGLVGLGLRRWRQRKA